MMRLKKALAEIVLTLLLSIPYLPLLLLGFILLMIKAIILKLKLVTGFRRQDKGSVGKICYKNPVILETKSKIKSSIYISLGAHSSKSILLGFFCYFSLQYTYLNEYLRVFWILSTYLVFWHRQNCVNNRFLFVLDLWCNKGFYKWRI